MTNWATDDLAQIAVAPRQEFAGLAEGIIRAWNPATFESVINVGGADLPNLPVASGVEALTYVTGDVVILSKWRPRSKRGIATYRVGMGGRVIVPGSGASEKAIAWMRGALAKEISAEVFAERVHEGFVEDSDTLSDQDTFTDLDPAGPEITDVNITFGVAIVWPSCSMAGSLDTGPNSVGGYMGVEVSGATTIAADITKSFHLRQTNHNSDGINRTDGALAGSTLVLPCAPGLHTFKAVYRTLSGPTTTVSFSQRSLVVIGI
jgi:hypothetical protein